MDARRTSSIMKKAIVEADPPQTTAELATAFDVSSLANKDAVPSFFYLLIRVLLLF